MKILEKGIYLIIFCLPLYLVRFTVLNIPTTVLEIMIYALFIIWLFKFFKFNEFKKLIITHWSLFFAIVLILIGVSIATILSWDLKISAGIWKAWFIDPLLFFIVLISVIKKPKQIKKIFWAFILSALIIGIISLVYLIQGDLDGLNRLGAFYDSPNYLSMYLAPALILSLGLSPLTKRKSKKTLLIISTLLFIICLFFTKSLGAWLGIIAVACFVLCIYLWKKNKKLLFWIIILSALLIIFVLGYLKLNSEFGKISINARLIIWQRALQVIKNYPFIGIGPGTFQDYFPPYPSWGVPQPHNIYLAFLLQTGLIGFIGFIWVLGWFFKSLSKDLNHNLRLLLIMLMIYILIHGLVDTTYWKNDLSVFFWLIIGLMVVLKNPR